MQKMRLVFTFLISLGLLTGVYFGFFFEKNPKITSPLPEGLSKRGFILTPTPTNTPTPTSTPTLTPTPFPTPTPTKIIIAPEDMEDLLTKYSQEYGVDKNLLKKIASCESGFNPNAKTSLYAGLFQFSESLWIQTRTLIGKDPNVNLRFDPEESIRTAAFLISQNHLGVWPNCSK